jgi:sarcosine oxidase
LQKLLHRTGCLNIGGECFSGALAAARQHGLAHQVLDGREASRAFPGYSLPADVQVLYEPGGGVLAPEAVIRAHCRVGTRRRQLVAACRCS